MAIIDAHSHVLPGIDDGSKSKDMSLNMLSMAVSQGVNLMVATPHFYADKTKVDEFVVNRAKAYEEIKPICESINIDVKLGAEVAYFRTLNTSEHLDKFLIEGTRLLLVEMPFEQWTSREVKTIDGLINEGIRPILAHLERFWEYQKDKSPLEEILDMDVICQYNAGSVLPLMKRGKVLKQIRDNDQVLLGSDCHNFTTRAPNLKEGRDMIAKKLGEERLQELDEFATSILL